MMKIGLLGAAASVLSSVLAGPAMAQRVISHRGHCAQSAYCQNRRGLLRWVQIALKPASKTLGLHEVLIRGKGLKYVIADGAFKRIQVDARAC